MAVRNFPPDYEAHFLAYWKIGRVVVVVVLWQENGDLPMVLDLEIVNACYWRTPIPRRSGNGRGAASSVTLTLTSDQALVLSHWLARTMITPSFGELVDDPAVWSPLLAMKEELQTAVNLTSDPTYGDQLNHARANVLADLITRRQ